MSKFSPRICFVESPMSFGLHFFRFSCKNQFPPLSKSFSVRQCAGNPLILHCSLKLGTKENKHPVDTKQVCFLALSLLRQCGPISGNHPEHFLSSYLQKTIPIKALQICSQRSPGGSEPSNSQCQDILFLISF